MTRLGYLGIDQHGTHYNLQKHPRKELLEKLGRNHASKMYVDLKSGGHRHAGYVIGGLWVSVYVVSEWKGAKP